MICSILIHAVLVVCAFWVFYDCVEHKIGIYSPVVGVDKGYRKGMSPIIWGISCFFIVPFFIYLFMRKSLIQRAIDNPAQTDKSMGFIILFILISVLTVYSYKDYLF
ncbi:Uncharacterised protein [Klebsiella pneumoniae]|nr:Uncharacterised protein [Klebsiella pneumoniae]